MMPKVRCKREICVIVTKKCPHLMPKKLNDVRKKIITLVICSCLTWTLFGQDVNYTQFYNAPFQINPALTGVFQGDVRLMANYREQWTSVPVEFRTATMAADMKLPSADGKSFFALGTAINHDQAGFANLRQTGVNVLGSYTRKLGYRFFATAGVQLGGNYRAFDISGISFGEQYDPRAGQFNPGRDNGEQFGNEENWFMSVGTGLNLRYQTQENREMIARLEKRTKIDVGIGFHHLNRPDQAFVGGRKAQLPLRLSPYASATIQVGSNFDVLGHFLGQFQGDSQQFLYGVSGKLHLNRDPGKQLAILLGGTMRTGENNIGAWSPVFELHYNSLRVGFSYDVNVSSFNVATDRRQGPEFSIRWMIRKVPIVESKTCPLI